jgi:hypothetical protein
MTLGGPWQWAAPQQYSQVGFEREKLFAGINWYQCYQALLSRLVQRLHLLQALALARSPKAEDSILLGMVLSCVDTERDDY